jgi:hypothetical protein
VVLYDVAGRRRLGEPLAVTEGSVMAVAFSPDGQTLAAGYYGGVGGGVVLYDVAPESWQHLACRIANRNLSWDEWSRFIGPDVPYRRLCPELPNGKGVDEALRQGTPQAIERRFPPSE